MNIDKISKNIYKLWVEVPEDADGNSYYDFAVSNDIVNEPDYVSDYGQCFDKTQFGTITTPHGIVKFTGRFGEATCNGNLKSVKWIINKIEFLAPYDI